VTKWAERGRGSSREGESGRKVKRLVGWLVGWSEVSVRVRREATSQEAQRLKGSTQPTPGVPRIPRSRGAREAQNKRSARLF